MTRQPDVLVVGGGVIGCSVAWQLAGEGLAVTLLERDELAGQASGAAAGMLLPWGESERESAFLLWAERSLARFPELCAELREASGIDPELELSGALHVADSEAAAGRVRAKARRFADRGLEWLGPEALRELVPQLAPAFVGAAWSPREGHVRSPRLTRAYAGAAAARGARLERGVSVSGLLRSGERVSGVTTAAGPRAAGRVVWCAGAWAAEALPFRLPIQPVRGQILALENTAPPLRRIVVAGGRYLVPKRDGQLVVGATEERVGFDCRVTASGVAWLLDAAIGFAPGLAESSLRGAWAGLRPASPDGLPAIGPVPGLEGLLVACGHHRNGVLLSPITGRLVADAILGKGLPEEAAAFGPERFV